MADLSGARVLLVEDDEINQEIAAEILGEFGITLDIADNGKGALTMLDQHRYDLVLMDVQMPVMDGIEATKRIRQVLGNTTIPIIAMTASVLPSDLEGCLVAGMNDHVAKPIDPDLLERVLTKWMGPTTVMSATPSQETSEKNAQRDELSKLSLIDGLDTAAGLRHLGGNKVLYVSLLKKFAATQGSIPDAIAEALAHGDWDMAERLAHTLKGSAATLGVVQVQQAAAALEAGIRSKKSQPQVDVLAMAVGVFLDSLIASLRRELSTPE